MRYRARKIIVASNHNPHMAASLRIIKGKLSVIRGEDGEEATVGIFPPAPSKRKLGAIDGEGAAIFPSTFRKRKVVLPKVPTQPEPEPPVVTDVTATASPIPGGAPVVAPDNSQKEVHDALPVTQQRLLEAYKLMDAWRNIFIDRMSFVEFAAMVSVDKPAMA